MSTIIIPNFILESLVWIEGSHIKLINMASWSDSRVNYLVDTLLKTVSFNYCIFGLLELLLKLCRTIIYKDREIKNDLFFINIK